MAWRMEYRCEAPYLPVLGSSRPNSSKVFAFGVAVNAKNDRFSCGPRADTALAMASVTGFTGSATRPASSASATVSSCSSVAPRASRRSSAASPVCDECASSTITAYCWPGVDPILSSTNGNVCSRPHPSPWPRIRG